MGLDIGGGRGGRQAGAGIGFLLLFGPILRQSPWNKSVQTPETSTGYDGPGQNLMKTRDFDALSRNTSAPPMRRKNSRRKDGMSAGTAFLGAVCVAGVFGVLALLYYLG
jgi:hypothetical protein